MTEALVADAWLGGLLGRPAFHLGATAEPTTAVAAPAFIDAKVPEANIGRAQALTNAGFRLINTSVLLTRPAGPIHVPSVRTTVRAAGPGDAEAVKDLAVSSFQFDRFHVDPAIANDIADRIKAAWAGNFFTGERGDRMLIAAEGAAVLGFLQILDRPQFSVIDLVAVAARARARGLAAAMIAHAIAAGRVVSWRVGTQAENKSSLRLYERLGFVPAEREHVFHRHIEHN